jgi:hypothetical protein
MRRIKRMKVFCLFSFSDVNVTFQGVYSSLGLAQSGAQYDSDCQYLLKCGEIPSQVTPDVPPVLVWDDAGTTTISYGEGYRIVEREMIEEDE